MRHIVSSAAMVIALGLAPVIGAAQEEDRLDLYEKDWPCHQRYRPQIDAAAVWTGPPLDAATRRWRDEPSVRRLAERLASPETSPRQGVELIDALAAELAAPRAERLTMLFAGVLDGINGYRRFAVDGIWEFVARRRLTEKVLAETEAAYAEVADDGSPDRAVRRQELERQRFWQYRLIDDFADEARFLCTRLTYLEGKLGTLARRIAGHIEP
jgi:hypothetical protein